MPKKTTTTGLKIKLVKSLIGSKQKQTATAESLGLKRIGDSTVQPNNPMTVGKIKIISHLVEVSEV